MIKEELNLLNISKEPELQVPLDSKSLPSAQLEGGPLPEETAAVGVDSATPQKDMQM